MEREGKPSSCPWSCPSSPASLLGYFSTETEKSNSSDYSNPCRAFKVPLLFHRTRKEGDACENLEEPAGKEGIVIEDTRIEELDSDFGPVVEILYDFWFLIPLKKGNMELPQVANVFIVYEV